MATLLEPPFAKKPIDINLLLETMVAAITNLEVEVLGLHKELDEIKANLDGRTLMQVIKK